MKKTLPFIICSLSLVACRNANIVKVSLAFTGADGTFNTVAIDSRDEIEIVENSTKGMVRFGDKFPAKYYLTIEYKDNKTANFMGNGPSLKNSATYIIKDPVLQQRYLNLINSKLPSYLQQK